MLYLTRRACKVANGGTDRSAIKSVVFIWSGQQIYGEKADIDERKASRMFGTEQRSDGFLVVVYWKRNGEQWSTPVSGPYETEQEAERRATELTERETKKPKREDVENVNNDSESE